MTFALEVSIASSSALISVKFRRPLLLMDLLRVDKVYCLLWVSLLLKDVSSSVPGDLLSRATIGLIASKFCIFLNLFSMSLTICVRVEMKSLSMAFYISKYSDMQDVTKAIAWTSLRHCLFYIHICSFALTSSFTSCTVFFWRALWLCLVSSNSSWTWWIVTSTRLRSLRMPPSVLSVCSLNSSRNSLSSISIRLNVMPIL